PHIACRISPHPFPPLGRCFVLLTQRPPRPTLFPYTTLFRSSRSSRASCSAISLHPPESLTILSTRVRLNTRRRPAPHGKAGPTADRKSTRLNSSHVKISYAVFCLKKKKSTYNLQRCQRNPRN